MSLWLSTSHSKAHDKIKVTNYSTKSTGPHSYLHLTLADIPSRALPTATPPVPPLLELLGSIKYFKKKCKDILFQQDNDLKHKSKKATSWIKDHKIQIMDWPVQSPDLNPIEHLWVYLKRQLAAYPTPSSGINALWECTQREWEAIDTAVVQNLIESMPRRVEEVIKARGGYTNY